MVWLFLVGLLVGVGVLWVVRRGEREEHVSATAPLTPTYGARRSALETSGEAPEDRPARAAEPSPTGPGEPRLSPAPPGPADFRGTGSLRGVVELYGGASAPERWTLVLRPSTTLFGREHAEEREVEHPGSQLEFNVPNLPLGGYDVQAVAEGRNGVTVPVLLTKRNAHPFVVIGLSPASFLEGYLVDGDGAPVEELTVTLQSAEGSFEREVSTDATGLYRFDGVRDGPYRLFVGAPAAPLLPAESLRLTSPGMRYPTLELPLLGKLDVFVQDADGFFLPGMTVRGSGTGGGVLEGVTDADGRIVFENLVPGRYRLRAEHPDDPELTSRRQAAELGPGDARRIDLRFPEER